MFIWNEVRIFAPQNQSCMKKYHYFLWLFLFLFVSCEKENLLDRMEQIKQVGNANPTLALEMLDSIQLKVRSESEYVQKKYDLLNVRLHDKADVLATSDIVVRELVPYFEENGSKAEQQEVHYYAGSVYRDLHDTPRALDHFLKALEIGKESDECDSIMLANTYSNLNHLYYRVQDYRNALPMAREECRLMTKQNRLDALAVLHVGAALTRLDSVESAKKTFQEALKLLKKTPHSYSEEQVWTSLVYHFSRFEMWEEARECYDTITKKKDWMLHSADYYLSMGEYYKKTGNLDSAISCYHHALEDGQELLGQYDGSKQLFYMYGKTGDISKAYQYAHQFVTICDSLDLGKRQEMAATVNNQFQYHKDMEEERKIREKKDYYRILFLSTSLGSIVGLLAFGTFFIYRRNRRLRQLLVLQARLQKTKEEKQKMEADISQRERELNEAETQLEEVKGRLNSVNGDLDHYTREVEKQKAMLEEKMEQNKSLMKLLHQTELETSAEDVIQTIRKSSEGKHKMSPAEWKQFFMAVDEIHPSFSENLLQKFGSLSEPKMQVYYLMRVGLSNAQIENLVTQSHATVWRWAKRYSELMEKK